MVGVFDPQVINAFVANPDNAFIVSFPRTGSHWLRMLMELYFDHPTMTRKFFLLDRVDYMAFHTHDDDLTVERKNVVYLWRDPVSTVYSQIVYKGEQPNAVASIERWADAYGKHLEKWLVKERFTTKKTIILYEDLVRDATWAMKIVSEHFGVPYDPDRAWRAASRVTKAEVKCRTTYDDNVMRLSVEHERGREIFRTHFSATTWRALLRGREELAVRLAKEDR